VSGVNWFSHRNRFRALKKCSDVPNSITFLELFMFRTMLPNAVVTCCVKYGKNDYRVGPNNEKKAIGKPSSENTTNRWTSANKGKGLGVF
jgi:hypothetical protein